MSEFECGDKKIPSNDEVINELTKDLESQCIKTDGEDKNVDIPEDFESEENSIEYNDFVDEDALKQEEENSILTPEVKNDRRNQAVDYKNTGNTQFKNEEFLEAVKSYTEAIKICPLEFKEDRAIYYGNRAAAKIKLSRIPSAIEDCTKSIELNPEYLKVIQRRAKLYEENDKLDESLEDYKRILQLCPDNNEARAATIRLPPLINERNEKMKAEMMGKLKDLGNLLLRPFGLSTDNFQMEQDPNSGGYSVKFQQNK